MVKANSCSRQGSGHCLLQPFLNQRIVPAQKYIALALSVFPLDVVCGAMPFACICESPLVERFYPFCAMHDKKIAQPAAELIKPGKGIFCILLIVRLFFAKFSSIDCRAAVIFSLIRSESSS
jgi:hypothetical protein